MIVKIFYISSLRYNTFWPPWDVYVSRLGVTQPCPFCFQNHFVALSGINGGGYFFRNFQDAFYVLALDFPYIFYRRMPYPVFIIQPRNFDIFVSVEPDFPVFAFDPRK